jgi:hypothetical protein
LLNLGPLGTGYFIHILTPHWDGEVVFWRFIACVYGGVYYGDEKRGQATLFEF